MKQNYRSMTCSFFTGLYGSGPSSPALFLSLLLFSSASSAELIDRVVASVNNEVITLSELNDAIAFNSSLGSAPAGDIRSETLAGLVNRRLLIQEARRLKFVDVSEQDVSIEIEKLKKGLGTEESFSNFSARLGINEGQLKEMLRERVLVERFIEKKIGLFIRVTREEAQEYFHRHAARFPGKQFADVQRVITTELAGQKLDKQIAEYLDELKSRADIRVKL